MDQIIWKELNQINYILGEGASSKDGLLSGNLGLSFYYYNLYAVSEEETHLAKGRRLLEYVFTNLNTGEPGIVGAAFSNGGAGLGYTVNALVRDHLLDMDIEKELADLDRFLFEEACVQIDNHYIDCLHGAFSIIHYFSERDVHSKANQYLNQLIEKVCKQAVKTPQGYWFRNYILQPSELEEINFSLSHGLSGMLLILIKAYDKSVHKDLIAETVSQGTRFISKHRLFVDFSNHEYSFFPFSMKVNASEIENRARLAWCYGDLNQVLLFYRAGRLLNDRELWQLAELVGMHSLTRKTLASTRAGDSQFCHGSAGLAQFYKQLYAETGNSKYLDGYTYWIEQTVLLLQHDLRIDRYKGKEHELLEGLVGIALTFLSYVSPKKLNWSKALLL